LGLPDLARLEEIIDDRTAQNGSCLATEKVPGALEEIKPKWQTRPSTGIEGNPEPHSQYLSGEPTLGITTNNGRAQKSGYQRGQVHG
jgi:hypothetical protein